jgi:hypothetical protein
MAKHCVIIWGGNVAMPVSQANRGIALARNLRECFHIKQYKIGGWGDSPNILVKLWWIFFDLKRVWLYYPRFF